MSLDVEKELERLEKEGLSPRRRDDDERPTQRQRTDTQEWRKEQREARRKTRMFAQAVFKDKDITSAISTRANNRVSQAVDIGMGAGRGRRNSRSFSVSNNDAGATKASSSATIGVPGMTSKSIEQSAAPRQLTRAAESSGTSKRSSRLITNRSNSPRYVEPSLLEDKRATRMFDMKPQKNGEREKEDAIDFDAVANLTPEEALLLILQGGNKPGDIDITKLSPEEAIEILAAGDEQTRDLENRFCNLNLVAETVMQDLLEMEIERERIAEEREAYETNAKLQVARADIATVEKNELQGRLDKCRGALAELTAFVSEVKPILSSSQGIRLQTLVANLNMAINPPDVVAGSRPLSLAPNSKKRALPTPPGQSTSAVGGGVGSEGGEGRSSGGPASVAASVAASGQPFSLLDEIRKGTSLKKGSVAPPRSIALLQTLQDTLKTAMANRLTYIMGEDFEAGEEGDWD